MITPFKDLLIWQRSMQLARDVYALTKSLPPGEQYGLCSQLRRAAVSIPSNIAEGRRRGGTKEFKQFLHIALGPVAEIETQLLLCVDFGYCNENEVSQLMTEIEELSKMISSLIMRQG